MQYDFATIEAATNKFSDDNKLGEGGFGQVYKVHGSFLGKLQSTFLKLGVVWILYPKIWEIGFYTWSFIPLAKPNPPLVIHLCGC